MSENHTRKYWQYEYDVSGRYMAPLLEGWGVQLHDADVLDVGCGEGGGVCALYDKRAQCAGFDIDEHRVQAADQLKGERRISFSLGNLYDSQLPYAGTRYDLVVLHDVFEHLDHKLQMIAKLKGYMKPGGHMLITFPPYFSAYGAHQQHLHAPFAKLPFFHLIPFSLLFILPRLKGESPAVVEEVQKLGRLKMGMQKFEQIAAQGGLIVHHKQAYFISPNHIRFGLKPIPAGPVAEIPVIGEVVCTGVVYLLTQA